MPDNQTAAPVDPVDAFMELVAERGFDDVGMPDVAERCGLKLSEMRRQYADPFALLAAFSERIDAEVLDNVPAELADDAPRERLFDVLMMRFDALAPYKPALAEIFGALTRNPLALAAWNRSAVRSQYWMMVAAGLAPSGPGGMAEAQGLVVVFGRTFRVWLKDDDAGMARTMAELDRRLREAEGMMRALSGFARTARGIASGISAIIRGGRRRRPRDEDRPGDGYAPRDGPAPDDPREADPA